MDDAPYTLAETFLESETSIHASSRSQQVNLRPFQPLSCIHPLSDSSSYFILHVLGRNY